LSAGNALPPYLAVRAVLNTSFQLTLELKAKEVSADGTKRHRPTIPLLVEMG